MNEELRKRIIAYNLSRKEKNEHYDQYKVAYDDFMKLIEPLFKLSRLLPDNIKTIIEKYREGA